MKCPHCLENFFEAWEKQITDSDNEGVWWIEHCICPSCNKVIIRLLNRNVPKYLVRPKSVSRSPLSPEVPGEFSEDYKEACLVLSDSPKASAALSRRCLQNLLREKAKTTRKDLADQIQEVLDKNLFPSHLSEGLDAVRNIGNFAVHTIKSKTTGEIVDVEAGEAEWDLDILEGLFDFYFVQPALLKKKKDQLNQKLGDVGKPAMK